MLASALPNFLSSVVVVVTSSSTRSSITLRQTGMSGGPGGNGVATVTGDVATQQGGVASRSASFVASTSIGNVRAALCSKSCSFVLTDSRP